MLLQQSTQRTLVQDWLVHRLTKNLGSTVGYKVGCTQSECKINAGGESSILWLLLGAIYHSPAIIHSNKRHMIGVEPEITIQLSDDLACDRPWTPERVTAVVDNAMPAIEIVESQFSTWPNMGILTAIEDNEVHRKVNLEKPVSSWTVQSILETEVSLSADGTIVRFGNSNNIDRSPFGVVACLANQLNCQRRALKSDDVVTTGVMADIYDAILDQRLIADYTQLSTVEMQTLSKPE